MQDDETPALERTDRSPGTLEPPPGEPTTAIHALHARHALHTGHALADAERRRPDSGRRAVDRRIMAVVEWMSDAFLALDADWRVAYANQEAARLNGTTPEALVGRSHWDVWPETRASEVERRYREAVRTDCPVQFEHHYADSGVWHDIRAYPSDDGGLAIFYRDITAQKALETERARQARELADAHDKAMAAEAQFRLLVDRVRDYAVFLLDPAGVVTYWGEGAQRIKGYTPQEAIGMHLWQLYPEDDSTGDGTAEEHLRIAAEEGEYIGEGFRRRKDGSHFLGRVVLTALRRRGELVGFSKITQDLTAEREREQALSRAILAAEGANLAKSQFLANTSHEIRTPLNAVIGYAELLDLELAGPLEPTQRQYVARIQSTSRHLLGIVNDVLDLSKIEAGAMRLAHEACSMLHTVGTAVQLVEPQLRARRLQLANACATGADVAYRADSERVRQVLVNLLSNAVRFTEAGGQITISCGRSDAPPPSATATHKGPFAFVRVQDTGVGIPPDELDRIWEAFVQVDARRTRRFGGSGLGLTISRHLARLMGGDLTVHSTPEVGSTFVLWLPAAELSEVRQGASRSRVAPPPAVDTAGLDAAAEAVVASLDETDSAQMRDIADALLTEVERVIATYVARLRTDPGTPSAHGLDESQAEDHMVTFLADIAACVSSAGAPDAHEALQDGTQIQRLIAERHGRQRARLGWQASEVSREYALLREELHAAVARRVTRGGATHVAQALALLGLLLERAERESLKTFEEAREE